MRQRHPFRHAPHTVRGPIGRYTESPSCSARAAGLMHHRASLGISFARLCAPPHMFSLGSRGV
eukprot:7149730-Pyramimonas_sp.AAC.1